MSKCSHGNYPGVNCEECDKEFKAARDNLVRLEKQRQDAKDEYARNLHHQSQLRLYKFVKEFEYYDNLEWDSDAQESMKDVLDYLLGKFEEKYCTENQRAVYGSAYRAVHKLFFNDHSDDLDQEVKDEADRVRHEKAQAHMQSYVSSALVVKHKQPRAKKAK